LEKSTEVMPHVILSFEKLATSPYERRSKILQVESSDPVPKALPPGKNEIEFMSDSWPVNVCVQVPVRMSQAFAAASQEPETNMFLSVELIARLMASLSWPLKVETFSPLSTSQSMQVESPDEVRICDGSMKRQHDK
jgi:hypothetical protein